MELRERHDLYRDAVFRVKSSGLALIRGVQNVTTDPVKRWPASNTMIEAPVVGSSVSALWHPDDNEHNWVLTAGKVQNLRVAVRMIHGVEVPADQVFSFWAHIGMPVKRRGFVLGREVREGCLIPTIAGGLCQLSNALYDAATKAGMTVLERHRHSAVVRGSLTEQDRDATVKWNYVDLRFRSSSAFRIEAELTHDVLKVSLRSLLNYGLASGTITNTRKAHVLNDCFACGNTSCARHPGERPQQERKATTAFLLDVRWPEYDEWLKTHAKAHDLILQPFVEGRPFRSGRYSWSVPSGTRTADVFRAAVERGLALRMHRGGNGSLPPLMARHDERLALAMCRRIPPQCTHVVVAQNLLPYAWREGWLGGRTFDVLMTRMPMEHLQRTLDKAAARLPESHTIKDHRAPVDLVQLENVALTKARRIITPHAVIAAIFNNKSDLIPWSIPCDAGLSPSGNKILFPAGALARKGAYEMREAARALDLELVVSGPDFEADGFWSGVRVQRAVGDPLAGGGLVVLPAHLQNEPRSLLRAMAKGIPVITTEACGLAIRDGVTIVPAGDIAALLAAIRAHSVARSDERS